MTIFYGEKPFVATSATQKTFESRGSEATGAVSILTSDTDYKLQLPCPEYLRLKRLQKVCPYICSSYSRYIAAIPRQI